MRRHITGIDHSLILVRDLDASRAAYEEFGFTVSPRGMHPPDHGTGNHTIMLAEDYLELLGVFGTVPGNERWRRVLAEREGLAGIALRIDDADAAVAEMAKDGIALTEPQRFARPVDLPNGGKGEAAFRTTKFEEALTPSFRLFCCQHLTRGNVWLPALLEHANTAYAIDHVGMIAGDPAAEAAVLARIFATAPRPLAGGGAAVATGSAAIHILSADAFAAAHRGADLTGANRTGPASLAVKVRSAARAEAALARNGVAFARLASGLAVAPRDAGGVLLLFVEG